MADRCSDRWDTIGLPDGSYWDDDSGTDWRADWGSGWDTGNAMQQIVFYLLMAGAVLGGISLFVASTVKVRAATLIVTLLVFASSLAPQMSARGYYGQTWLYPLQALRAELYLAFGIALAAIVAVHAGRVRLTHLSSSAVLILIINYFAGILDTRETVQDGVFRIGLATATLGSLALYCTALFRTWDDYLPMMRAIGLAGLLWIGGSMVQAVLDQSQMLVDYGRRFVGLLGNPQGTAVYLGPMTTILLWLVLNDPARRMRWMWTMAFALVVMMVIWTGSRTGSLMAILGILFLLRARLGRAVILIPILGIGLIGVIYIVDMIGIELPFARLVGGGDTRTDAWKTLIDDALNAGFFGEGWGGARYVENSFLLGAVMYGPLMLALLLLLVGSLFILSMKLWRVRKQVPKHVAGLIDLIIAYSAMLFVGGQFEWFIISRVDANLPLIVILSCMGVTILALAREQALPDEEQPQTDRFDEIEYGEDPDYATQAHTH